MGRAGHAEPFRYISGKVALGACPRLTPESPGALPLQTSLGLEQNRKPKNDLDTRRAPCSGHVPREYLYIANASSRVEKPLLALVKARAWAMMQLWIAWRGRMRGRPTRATLAREGAQTITPSLLSPAIIMPLYLRPHTLPGTCSSRIWQISSHLIYRVH